MQQQQPSFGEKCRMTMGVEKKYCFSAPNSDGQTPQHVDITYAKRKSSVSNLAKAIFFFRLKF
jgi:hypothetical protein